MSSNMNFVKGVGVGIVIGSAIGAAVVPAKKNGRSIVAKTLKTMGNVVENITDSFSM